MFANMFVIVALGMGQLSGCVQNCQTWNKKFEGGQKVHALAAESKENTQTSQLVLSTGMSCRHFYSLTRQL